MMGGIGWGMGLAGWLWMFGSLILFAGLVALFVRALSGPDRIDDRMRPLATALAILRERFARGEISEAEFEQAKKALGYA